MDQAGRPSGQGGGTGRRFRPGFWLTLCTLGALAILIAMGIWQIQRLHWKNDLIAERQARLAEAPIALPTETVEPADFEFLRVRLSGHFLHDKELYLGGRARKRAVGFHVVTPLLLDDGRSILVDRGWVPPERKDPATRPEGRPEGATALEAVLRTGGWKGRDMFRPENAPAQNHWIWMDLPAMAQHVELERPMLDLYAVAQPAGSAQALPIAEATRVNLRNDHLQYAITWFALAVALLVIYILVAMKRDRTQAE